MAPDFSQRGEIEIQRNGNRLVALGHSGRADMVEDAGRYLPKGDTHAEDHPSLKNPLIV